MMKNKWFLMIGLLANAMMLQAQELFVDQGTLVVDNGGTLIIKDGSLTSNANVFVNTTGKIILKGNAASNKINLNLSGTGTAPYYVDKLEIDNPYGAVLTGHAKIGNTITFTQGNLYLGNYNLTLRNDATTVGHNDNRCIITNGTGYCEKELLTSNVNDGVFLPVGYIEPYNPDMPPTLIQPTRFAPMYIYNEGGVAGSGGTPRLRAQVKFGRSPNAPVRTESYITAYWPIRSSYINGGNMIGQGSYGYYPSARVADFSGIENDIVGFGYNNQDWLLAGGSIETTGNAVVGKINTSSGEIFGMNKFVYLKAKLLLQGAYGTGGLMNDNLRSGTNLIPLSDPYRTAPYNTAFTHVNNPVKDSADASVFDDQTNASNNIVDWVFVELRSRSNNSILRTRSALLQRDGDIVDIDGKQPLYFKNLDQGNYNITVRHRNHLAMSNSAATGVSLSNLSYLSNFDFTTAPASSILGTTGSSNFNSNNFVRTDGLNLMYGGNANAVLTNNRVSYSGSANDAAYILGPVLNGAFNELTDVYHPADVNMDRKVNFTGNNNDPGFILNKVLVGFPSGTRTEIKHQ